MQHGSLSAFLAAAIRPPLCEIPHPSPSSRIGDHEVFWAFRGHQRYYFSTVLSLCDGPLCIQTKPGDCCSQLPSHFPSTHIILYILRAALLGCRGYESSESIVYRGLPNGSMSLTNLDTSLLPSRPFSSLLSLPSLPYLRQVTTTRVLSGRTHLSIPRTKTPVFCRPR